MPGTRDREDVEPTAPGEMDTMAAPVADGDMDTIAGPELSAPRRPAGVLGRGDNVGRYVVLRKLGAGGMGTVYLGYDPDLDRKVALKLLHTHRQPLPGDEDHHRLLREAQAIAKLTHPHVITVHDVGEHEGRVYVAMEFVDGQTLDGWLHATRRTWREVLQMFLRAGRGLEAAHKEGLVHRDFKPDNVMIGNDGRVRVMDFGLARPTGPRDPTIQQEEDSFALPSVAALASERTVEGSIAGTPAYMSPGQHRGEDVGPKADQYSFCVALWEGLYGVRPFGGETFAELVFNITEGQIRESPARGVPGWLRSIVRRGFMVDPRKRWASMSELLSMLERGQVARRRRLAFSAATVALFAGAAVPAYQRYEVAQQTSRCEEAGASVGEVWNPQAREAVRAGIMATNVSYAESTADRVLESLDAMAGEWTDARTEACLDGRVRRIWNDDLLERSTRCFDERRMSLEAMVEELEHANDISVQKAAKVTGEMEGVAACRDAQFLTRIPMAPTAEEGEAVALVKRRLSKVKALALRGELEPALELAQDAVTDAEQIGWRPLIAQARGKAGGLLDQLGKHDEAGKELQHAYFIAAESGAYHVAAETANELTYVYGVMLSRSDMGEVWSRHEEVALTQLGEPKDGIRYAAHANHLGAIHNRDGRYEEATREFARSIELYESNVGGDHPLLAAPLNNLALVHYSTGSYDRARDSMQRIIEIYETSAGPNHPAYATAVNNLGGVMEATGAYEDAGRLHRRALAIREEALPPDHPDIAMSLNNVANVQWAQKNYDQAKPLYERALVIREKAFGPDHGEVAATLNNLANVHKDTGDLEAARPLYERAAEIWAKGLGPEHPLLGYPVTNLAGLAFLEGHYDEARSLAEQGVKLRAPGKAPPQLLAESQYVLAQALWVLPAGEGRDRTRAHDLAEEARDALAKAEGQEALAEELETWLQDHPAERQVHR